MCFTKGVDVRGSFSKGDSKYNKSWNSEMCQVYLEIISIDGR